MFKPDPKPIKKDKNPVCKNCGKEFTKQRTGQNACDYVCSIAIVKKEAIKKEAKRWRAEKKERLEKIKTISDWKNDLQKEINWIVKQIDKDYPCISHPNTKGFLRYDAGHAYTVKVHSDIRFNLHNIHKQNSDANERYGFCTEYAAGLQSRYGQVYLNMILTLPIKYKGIGKEKYTIENIKNIYLPAARKIVREIKEGYEFTRDQVNELIGIYV